MKSRPVMFVAAVLLLATQSPAVLASGQSRLRLSPGVVEVGTQAQLQALGRSLPSEAIDAAGARAAIERATASGQLDLGAMPIEDAVVLMLQLIAGDAESDLKLTLAEMNASNQKKKALREQEQASQRSAVAGSAKLAPARTRLGAPAAVSVTPSTSASVDVPPEPGDVMQLRLQRYMDRRAKATETLSNLLKKTGDSADQILENMK